MLLSLTLNFHINKGCEKVSDVFAPCCTLMSSDVTMNAALALPRLWAPSLSLMRLDQMKTNCPVPCKQVEFCLHKCQKARIRTSEAAVVNGPSCFSWPVPQ